MDILEQSAKIMGEIDHLPRGGYQTKQDYVYQSIKDKIVYGEFKPGDRLEIRDLAEMFDVSMTPVRAALIKLEVDGLVQYAAHSGAKVERLKPHDLLDAHAVVAVLQGLAAERAALQHSAEDALLLRAYIRCFQQMPEDDSPVKYNHLNYAFHLAIVRISRYDILVSQMENLFDILRRAESVWVGFEKYRDCSLEEHAAIVDAIVRGDPAEARRLSEQHYLRLRRDLESQIRKLEEGAK